LSIRNVLTGEVRQAIMKVSRVSRKICEKVVYTNQEAELHNDAVIALCMLEKEFPLGFFDFMTHLLLHLAEEIFLCGPVQCRWMYPMERFMKTLKDYVRTRARPEGSMAEGYAMDDTLGFCTEYMTRFSGTIRRVWDSEEDQSMYNEVMEGSWQTPPMTLQFRQWAHDFVLENSDHLAPWRW
jgi:hypothetical protein